MEVIDQLGRKVQVPEYPQRIVSLVPSQTELLADYNLYNNVVGITRFCERPKDWFYKKARVGGTKDPDTKRIAALKPDLILGNAEENTKKVVLELEKHYPVWLSDVKNLNDSYTMMSALGELTNRTDTSKDWITRIQNQFAEVLVERTGLKVLYLIWKNPWMAAGRDTFINDMIEKAGYENVIPDPESRYPKLEPDEIRAMNPDVVFLSSEPYPFSDDHIEEIKNEFSKRAIAVDGAIFSWYGSRLLHSPRYFRELQNLIL